MNPITHSIETTAPAPALFKIFSDVESWPEWNAGVERMEIDGPFEVGATTLMKMPHEDEPLTARLSWVQQDVGFADETPMPGSNLIVQVRHELEPLIGGGTRITYTTMVIGYESEDVGLEIAQAVSGDFPEVLASLARRAEATEEH